MVYGVVTEVCVKLAAFGLLRMGKPVDIVTDAIRALKEADGLAVLDDFVRLGGSLTTSATLL